MDFYNYQTMYEFFFRNKIPYLGIQASNPEQFYKEVKHEALPLAVLYNGSSAATLHNQSESERMWYENHRPYYKVFPDWLPTFALTKLDVPNQYLRAPFASLLIRLPVNHGIKCLTAKPGYEVRTVLVSETPGELILLQKDPTERQFTLWIDFGEIMDLSDNTSFPVYTFQNIRLRKGDTVEEGLAREQTPEKLSPNMKIGLHIPQYAVTACVKVAVSTLFLATGANKLVQPDVLSKHLNKLLAARDENTKQLLHAKAKKRGKHGWTIGRRELSFPSTTRRSESEGKTGHQLSHSHLRSGHFHVVRYGPSKTKTRVDWFTETIVRPDLPPSTEQRGYKSKV